MRKTVPPLSTGDCHLHACHNCFMTTNSAIHKAAGSLVTGHSQKSCWQEPPPEAIPTLTASQLDGRMME